MTDAGEVTWTPKRRVLVRRSGGRAIVAGTMPTPATAKWPKPRSEDEFEDIVVDFARIRWKDPNAQRYGRRGQRQNGVDVIGSPPWLSGGVAAAQCKNTDSLSLADVVAEVDKATSFSGLAEFYLVTSGDRDAALQSQVRAHFRASPAPFDVDIVFWPDVAADISADERLIAKHWPGFGSIATHKHLCLIQTEAHRMKEYGERLLADLTYDRWKSLQEKFRPGALENASREAVCEIATDPVLLQSLNSLRVAAAVADEKIDRVLQQSGPFRLHPHDILEDVVIRVINEAHHVGRGMARLFQPLL